MGDPAGAIVRGQIAGALGAEMKTVCFPVEVRQERSPYQRGNDRTGCVLRRLLQQFGALQGCEWGLS